MFPEEAARLIRQLKNKQGNRLTDCGNLHERGAPSLVELIPPLVRNNCHLEKRAKAGAARSNSQNARWTATCAASASFFRSLSSLAKVNKRTA